MPETSLYLAHRERATKFLGPGKRYAIWTQGCLKRCPGCVFPEGWPLDQNGEYAPVSMLLSEIMERQAELRGVTISGGEPFLQAAALRVLILAVRENTNLDIMVYSGYTLAELENMKNADIACILSAIDLLVDGEYRAELNNDSIYRGSDNQEILFLSPRYLPWKEKMLAVKNRSVEFAQKGDDLFLVGIPAKNFNQDFHNLVCAQERQ